LIIKASLDRFSAGYAVIYSSDGRKFDVPKNIVPHDCKAGSRLKLYLDDSGAVAKIELDSKSTDDAKRQISKRYARLSRGEHRNI
jgi:hypothetical protein